MTKINWRVRLQSRTFWLSAFALIGFILGEFNVWDAGRYDALVDILLLVLVSAGVIVDPTTAGISDSKQALGYGAPRKDGGI